MANFRDGTLYYGQLKSGSKRHALTGKQGNKHYYKGTRSTGIVAGILEEDIISTGKSENICGSRRLEQY